jgi:hypothetical protein
MSLEGQPWEMRSPGTKALKLACARHLRQRSTKTSPRQECDTVVKHGPQTLSVGQLLLEPDQPLTHSQVQAEAVTKPRDGFAHHGIIQTLSRLAQLGQRHPPGSPSQLSGRLPAPIALSLHKTGPA